MASTTQKAQPSITSTENSNLLDQLAAEFPKSEVKSRAGGFGKNLDYIDIPSTINRFNAVCGAGWDWTITEYNITPIEGKYVCTVRGNITVQLPVGGFTVRSGIGADIDKDPDKALKTADAEALKKAGHKFGVALYLWDEGKRNEIEDFRKLKTASISTLQAAVMASTGLSKELLVKTYGEALKTREGLLSILDGSVTGA